MTGRSVLLRGVPDRLIVLFGRGVYGGRCIAGWQELFAQEGVVKSCLWPLFISIVDFVNEGAAGLS